MSNQRGFTLPELLVVGTVGLLLVGVGIFLIRPNDFGAEKRNAERRLHLASIMMAIEKYEADTGNLPPNIIEDETTIGNEEGGPDLCDDLVPKYAKDLPKDPAISLKVLEDSACNDPQQLYVSGYTARLAGDRVILAAPAAEKDEIIELEQWFSVL